MAMKSFFKFIITGSKEMDEMKKNLAQLQEEVKKKEEGDSLHV